jgi:hypothetical protein
VCVCRKEIVMRLTVVLTEVLSRWTMSLKFLRVLKERLRRRMSIDDMQFGFMPGRGTTDAIVIIRQVQEKFLAKNRELWIAVVDLEKAFDRVPREVLWWALRRLGVEEWIVIAIKALYEDATTSVSLRKEKVRNLV